MNNRIHLDAQDAAEVRARATALREEANERLRQSQLALQALQLEVTKVRAALPSSQALRRYVRCWPESSKGFGI